MEKYNANRNNELTLSKQRIVEILNDCSNEMNDILFERAREVREENFGNKIFSYGFVYFSTFCRNDCNFCYYRSSNNIERYRKSYDDVMHAVKQLASAGVNLIDLTMGEDNQFHNENFETVLKIVRAIKDETHLPIMLSPGIIHDNLIDQFAEMDVDWYALYQETHNQRLFNKLRVNQDFDERIKKKLYAKTKGMFIEEGLLVGIGEDEQDIADSLLMMGKLGASQMRVMSFVPQKGSPMENVRTPDRVKELKIIALMRILYPHALIPASLDVDGIEGLEARIKAGANVVTSIIPPLSGLMGVAHSTLDVDEGGRTVEEVQRILNDMNLELASVAEYKAYLIKLKTKMQRLEMMQNVESCYRWW